MPKVVFQKHVLGDVTIMRFKHTLFLEKNLHLQFSCHKNVHHIYM
jgi:hypothetical protein